MAAESSKPVLIATLLTGTAAVALIVFSAHVSPRVRPAVRDLLQPGQRRLESVVTNARSAITEWAGEPRSTSDRADAGSPASLEIAQRQLEIINARLREDLQRKEKLGSSPYRSGSTQPLVIPELVTARILGEETARLWRGGLLADRGTRNRLRESDLVLQDDAPLADAGKDNHLEQGFPVFAGRTVFGRVQSVGRWSCTIQRVTDPEFRSHAQLIRKISDGHVFGAGGVIVGTGRGHCRLTMVSSSEPVSVGDGVYTPSDAGFPFPMFYGTVVKATPGATQWEIIVKPAATEVRPRTVQILRKRFNPARFGVLRPVAAFLSEDAENRLASQTRGQKKAATSRRTPENAIE